MVIQSLLLSMAKWVGSLLLGGVILWHVVEHSGLAKGRAIVHVTKPGVELKVDDVKYRVATLWDSPIVCELNPG